MQPLATGRTTNWDRLLFSAKESVHEARFPLARRWAEVEDASITVDRTAETFHARLLMPGPDLAGRPLREFHGRRLAGNDLVSTAITLLAAPNAAVSRRMRGFVWTRGAA
ncbi:hypothetical protein [Saccharopolyspora spinosa]|uniref:hypothetical protein n=1 Tax=Saccharopolyspora spinosa TaxID=60894 RepID=UPI0002DD50DA|nr:hypothetical protein [Saccharopolyspora spinosa]